jgi:hypothetical protein
VTRSPFDDLDRDRPRRRRPRPISALAILGWFSLGVLILGVIVAVGIQAAKRPEVVVGGPHVYQREEFRRAFQGKTPEEVVRILGRPDSADESPRHQQWTWYAQVRNPITGKAESGWLNFEPDSGGVWRCCSGGPGTGGERVWFAGRD